MANEMTTLKQFIADYDTQQVIKALIELQRTDITSISSKIDESVIAKINSLEQSINQLKLQGGGGITDYKELSVTSDINVQLRGELFRIDGEGYIETALFAIRQIEIPMDIEIFVDDVSIGTFSGRGPTGQNASYFAGLFNKNLEFTSGSFRLLSILDGNDYRLIQSTTYSSNKTSYYGQVLLLSPLTFKKSFVVIAKSGGGLFYRKVHGMIKR